MVQVLYITEIWYQHNRHYRQWRVLCLQLSQFASCLWVRWIRWFPFAITTDNYFSDYEYATCPRCLTTKVSGLRNLRHSDHSNIKTECFSLGRALAPDTSEKHELCSKNHHNTKPLQHTYITDLELIKIKACQLSSESQRHSLLRGRKLYSYIWTFIKCYKEQKTEVLCPRVYTEI